MIGALVTTCVFVSITRNQNVIGSDGHSKRVLKLAHSLDQSHPVHKAMLRMAELLTEKSGGTVELQIFPNGQLGSETECIEQLQRGALAMTKTSTAPMESFVPEMAIFGIPYAFRGEEHFWNVMDGEIGKRLLAAGKSNGLRGLCFYDAGSRNFYTISQPVLKPDDLAGLKIRVQESKTAMDMVEALGGAPTPISFGELYTALQQKMVDGAENNPPSFYSNRHFEVCKHLSMDEHTRVPDILLISNTVWESLPEHAQQWVQDASDESSEFQRTLWRAKSEEALVEVQKAGVTVHYPDKAVFAERVLPMHQSYDGTDVGKLLEAIKEL